MGLLHGALAAADEGEGRCARSPTGEIDVLVATTVVELGIDVPNATVMIVEDADRFGLAQLHQLRGRVGRGAAPGLCFLCPPAGGRSTRRGGPGSRSCARVDDGFRLAEADLAQRGFGELLGTRQAGAPCAGARRSRELADLTALGAPEAEALLATIRAGRPEHAALAAAARARAATLFAGEAG